jgi:hypothetical protein
MKRSRYDLASFKSPRFCDHTQEILKLLKQIKEKSISEADFDEVVFSLRYPCVCGCNHHRR